jgi:hypothetical protein
MIFGKSSHRLVLFDDDGLRLQELKQIERFSYWRAANSVGGFSMTLKPDFDDSLIDVDHLIYFWRKARGGVEKCECVGMCRAWGWGENTLGQDRFVIEGADQNDLVDRRIIAYFANSAQSSKTDFSDDMLKAIIRENMGTLAPLDEAGRPRAYDADYFSVMADTSEGANLTRSFAWRYVLPTIQELCQSSRDLGYPLYFDMVPSSAPGVFEFHTYVPYLGKDRSATSSVPVIFSKEYRNLGKPKWREDWFEERNYVYGGGQGEDDDRTIDPEDDVWRMHKSRWNRRECFQDAREEETVLGVANKAYERMQKERPVVIFEADLLDTPRTRFGKDFDYGDLISAKYRGREFDAMVDAFKITVDASGKEELEIRTEVEYAFGWQ